MYVFFNLRLYRKTIISMIELKVVTFPIGIAIIQDILTDFVGSTSSSTRQLVK